MKNKVRLTESDLIELIKRAINEQSYGETAFEEHMGKVPRRSLAGAKHQDGGVPDCW